jgi:hypothetical protein
MNIIDALVKHEMIMFHREGRRLIAQGAVRRVVPLNVGGWGSSITDTIKSPDEEVEEGETILVGASKQFVVGD